MKNLFKLSIISILIILCYNPAAAQVVVKLSSKILNQRNQPVAGATVSAKGQRSVPANADGEYVLQLAEGRYTITVSAVGYQTKEVTEVDVKANLS